MLATNTHIFGMRFRSNEELQPGPGELAAFLDAPRPKGLSGRHRDDIAGYAGLLERVGSYEAGQLQMTESLDLAGRMQLGVLAHSRLFTPGLRVAVEEYKYHLDQLERLDPAKPLGFIRSAEQELRKLDRRRKEDLPKIARFEGMIGQRKRDLDELEVRRRMLAGELYHIAVYVRDNLAKVRKVCEDAITRLAALQVSGTRVAELVRDLKAHFKDQVRDNRDLAGGVTTAYLDTLKEEVADLSRRLPQLLLHDLFAVTSAFEAIHDHSRDLGAQLEGLTTQAAAARERGSGPGWDAFARIERTLVKLIATVPAAPRPQDEGTGSHEALLREKRREMLDHVFGQLRTREPAGPAARR